MNQTAQGSDFAKLPPDLQAAHLTILRTCEQQRLSCRCEVVGRDFVIIIGRGYSSPKYWMDLFQT